MELTDVLDSKVFVKGSSINFNSPRKYLEPFLESMNKLNPKWEVDVSGIVSNAEDDNTMNTAYGRVAVQGLLPDCGTSESAGTIGIVYALDTQKPTVRVFTGQNVSICMNLCIFGAEHVFSADLLGGGMDRAYEMARQYIERKEEEVQFYVDTIGRLRSTQYHPEEVDQVIGRLLKESLNNKLGSSSIISAVRELTDPKSKYSLDSSGETNAWNIYNAVTDHISHKVDIFDRAIKTILLSYLVFYPCT